MLLIQINGTLSCLIANDIAVCEILSNDTGSRFLFLGDLIAITLSLCGIVAAIILVGAGGGGDLDMSGAELGVVKEQSSLCGSLLFEGYCSILSLAGRLDLNAGDLATVCEVRDIRQRCWNACSSANVVLPEGKEVLNFFLAGGGRDVLNVDGAGRHLVGFFACLLCGKVDFGNEKYCDSFRGYQSGR